MGSLWIVVDSCGVVVDRCGSLWIVVGHCGSLWVVPGFSNYVCSIYVIYNRFLEQKNGGSSSYNYYHDLKIVPQKKCSQVCF